MHFSESADWLFLAGTFLIFIYVSASDIKYGRIPNWCVVFIVALGMLFIAKTRSFDQIASGLTLGIGGFLLRQLFFKSTKRHGLGVGDVKLMLACGLWLPPAAIPQFLILSGCAGIATAYLWKIYKCSRPDKSELWQDRFPFAPSLSIAWSVTIFL